MRLAIAVILIGCGGSKPAPEKPTSGGVAPDCKVTIDGMYERWDRDAAAQRGSEAEVDDLGLTEALKTAIIASCTEDKWSAEVVRCLETVQPWEQKCEDMLTPDQAKKQEARVEAEVNARLQ
ncbi:MAG TPA: hypothetical protein VIU61_19235 [Kofleriaceae bacterium]